MLAEKLYMVGFNASTSAEDGFPGAGSAGSPVLEGREPVSWLTSPWLTIRVQIGLGR